MKTSTAYASGWVHAILLAAAFGCGGGGEDAPGDAMPEPNEPIHYVPAKDWLIPIAPEWGDMPGAFEVRIVGNWVEAE